MDYREAAREMKADSYKMASLTSEVRNKALSDSAEALEKNKAEIFSANERDRSNGADLPAPILARLKFDEHKLADCISGIRDLIEMPDPLFQKQMVRELDEGLTLVRSSCPIGVIGVIFESRPDALVQISALCIKSGNSVILKGGSEAMESNRKLFDTIYNAGVAAGLPEGFAMLVESREGVSELLSCHESIDLIIPRGSNEFVQHIMSNTKIPVMGHADGICTIYVDKDADVEKARLTEKIAKEHQQAQEITDRSGQAHSPHSPVEQLYVQKVYHYVRDCHHETADMHQEALSLNLKHRNEHQKKQERRRSKGYGRQVLCRMMIHDAASAGSQPAGNGLREQQACGSHQNRYAQRHKHHQVEEPIGLLRFSLPDGYCTRLLEPRCDNVGKYA